MGSAHPHPEYRGQEGRGPGDAAEQAGGGWVLRLSAPMKEVGFILNPDGRVQVQPSPSKLLAELSL